MSARAKCSWGGCGRDARWQIGLRMWALATPTGARTSKNGITMLSGVTICEECRPKVKPSDFTLPEAREWIGGALLRMGKALPDFDAAQLTFEEIVDAPIDIEAEVRRLKMAGAKVWEA